MKAGPQLIGDGDLVGVVDREDSDGCLARLEMQTQFLLDGLKDIGQGHGGAGACATARENGCAT